MTYKTINRSIIISLKVILIILLLLLIMSTTKEEDTTNEDNFLLDTGLEYNSKKLFNILREWCENQNNYDLTKYLKKLPDIDFNISVSDMPELSECYEGETILIQQFYIDEDPVRNKEIQQTLRFNCINRSIDKIILLNEKIYTEEELGTKNDKIQQVNIEKRLTYADAFKYAHNNHRNSYIILSNIDIFYDKSIEKIKLLQLHEKMRVLTLLRYEFLNNAKLSHCKIEHPRPDLQDTWVWHTNAIDINDSLTELTNIEIGVHKSNNHFMHILQLLGIQCLNIPETVKSYHNHNVMKKNCREDNVSQRHYNAMFPYIEKINTKNLQEKKNNISMDIFTSNNNLFSYIQNNMENKQTFCITMTDGVLNNLSLYANSVTQSKRANNKLYEIICEKVKNSYDYTFKNDNDALEIGINNLKTYETTDKVFSWQLNHDFVKKYKESYLFLNHNYKKKYGFLGDLTNIMTITCFETPWLKSISEKNVLILENSKNDFSNEIKNAKYLKNITIDKLPDNSNMSMENIQTYVKDIVLKYENIDIVLLDASVYSNIICVLLKQNNISSINMGFYLKTIFNIIDKDILNQYSSHIKLQKIKNNAFIII